MQNIITTGPEVASERGELPIACMDLAKEAFDRHEPESEIFPPDLEPFQGGFELFKEEIISFRKRLLALEQKIPKADRFTN